MAFGRAGLYLGGLVAELVTATGQEVLGHGRSWLQKSQPEPSLYPSHGRIEGNVGGASPPPLIFNNVLMNTIFL